MFSDLSQMSYYSGIEQRIGGKAANLVRMQKLLMPVPMAYVIPIKFSEDFNDCPNYVLELLDARLGGFIDSFSYNARMPYGDKCKPSQRPLLLSVRSGAAVSMPGMMDTVLNVGLNDKTVKALASSTNPEFAWDSYRRFIQSYGTTVLNIPSESFEKFVEAARHFCPAGIPTVAISQHLVDQFKMLCNGEFPQDPQAQLRECIVAVLLSWNSERAQTYRNVEKITEATGTAVLIQQMVYGNLNKNSGTGVVFTRNPISGDSELYGDFLINAQGEDVVNGSSNTLPIDKLSEKMPDVYQQLQGYITKLEIALRDMCDIEFTIEDGKLYMLQVRKGKRSARANNRIALQLFREFIIDLDQAEEMLSVDNKSERQIDIDGYIKAGCGLVASEGDVEGYIATSKESAIELSNNGKTPILITRATDPADMPGIAVAAGIITLTGGLVSHAAVVARAWNKSCVVGLADSGADVTLTLRQVHIGPHSFSDGDKVAIKTTEGGSIYFKKA